MAMFYNLFSDKNGKRGHLSSKTAAMSQDSYEDDLSESSNDEDGVGLIPFLPRNNFKTNIACIAFSCLSHYLYGIFFNAYESVNARYDYPNVGSMSFVLATVLILIRFKLVLKSLPIEVRTWKYSFYKVLAVTFITHLVLAGIWQQLVNLTWELFFATKDLLEFLNNHSDKGILHVISENMTSRAVNMLTYLEGLAILTLVIINSSD